MSETQTQASNPPAKKRRLDNLGNVYSFPSVTRSSELWLDDGNIILQVEATQFRVHRGVISGHSSFFKDMFMIPQPDGEPLVEGCPVIHIPDKYQDWENILMVIYHSCKLYFYPKDYPIPIIISMLRIGNKYQIDHFRDTAIKCLKIAIPTSSALWISMDTKECAKGFEFDLVNVALEVGLQSILPVVYPMCLTNYCAEVILDGIKKDDDTMSCLPHEVKKILFRARERILLRTAHVMGIEATCNIDHDGCDDISRCIAFKSGILVVNLRNIMENVGHGFDQFRAPVTDCAYCLDQMEGHFIFGRSRLWQSLPSFFDLPDWNSLGGFV